MARITLFLLFIGFTMLQAQESQAHLTFDGFLYDGYQQEEHKLYGVQYKDFERARVGKSHLAEYAYKSFLLEENRSEDLLLEALAASSDPVQGNKIMFSLSDIYFEQEAYSKSLNQLNQVNEEALGNELLEEYYFKKGYLSLVNYKFEESIGYLDQALKQDQKKLTEPAIYYKGMNYYFLSDFESGIKNFEKVATVQDYSPYIPYYLTQIYFAQGKFEEVISYGKNQLQSERTENKYEIEKLIGQSYYKQADYRNALVHFNIYEKNTSKLNKEEFYQFGYTYYKLGEYDKAIPMLLEIKGVEGDMGQLVNYYLADSYLKTSDKKSALTAFKNAKNIGNNNVIHTEAKFNYAKLAYELGNDRLSIKTLSSYKPEEQNFRAAQSLLGDILVRSNDYETAMQTIERLENKSAELSTTYQKLALKSAFNSMADEKVLQAITFFNLAMQQGSDFDSKAKASYWLASLYQDQGKIDRMEDQLSQYFQLTGIENHETFFLAKYLSAYHLYKQGKTQLASVEFQSAIQHYQELKYPKSMYYDAAMRNGDCLYQLRDYKNASQAYGLADYKSNSLQDYVLFQQANIEAAKGDKYESIVRMDELVQSYPASEYYDDALYFNGQNYQALGKSIAALKEYDKIIDSDLVSDYKVPALLRSALISYNSGDMKSALINYRKVFQLGANGKEKQEALKALEEIYVVDLNDPQSYFEFARTEAGLEIDDFSKDSLSYSVANAQFKKHKYRDAINAYDKYLSGFPEGYYQAEAKYFRGESYSLMKEYTLAKESYTQLLALPNSSYYNRAIKKAALIAFNHENDFAQASDFALKALETNLTKEEERDFLEIATVSLFNIGDFDRLLATTENLLQIEDLKDYEIAKVNYYKAKALQQLGKNSEALTAYNTVIRLSQNNQAAEASYELAKMFFTAKQYKEAESQALETTKRAANYPNWVAKSLILLADIYLQTDDAFNAKAAIEAVIENYQEDPIINSEAQNMKTKIEKYEAENSRIKETESNKSMELDGSKNQTNG